MRELNALKRRYESHVPGLLGVRRRYAVLCPFVEVEGEAHILFEVRAKGLRQEGEVCFPGGHMEAGETALECALRETEEELGIPRSQVTVFGQSDFQAGQDGFILHPLLGEVSAEGFAAIEPSQAEVAEVFTVPVRFFQQTDPEVYIYELAPKLPPDFPYEAVGIRRDYPWRGGRVTVPVWYYENHVIWGLTARVIKDIMQK